MLLIRRLHRQLVTPHADDPCRRLARQTGGERNGLRIGDGRRRIGGHPFEKPRVGPVLGRDLERDEQPTVGERRGEGCRASEEGESDADTLWRVLGCCRLG